MKLPIIIYHYKYLQHFTDTRIRRSVKANSVKAAYIDFKLVMSTNDYLTYTADFITARQSFYLFSARYVKKVRNCSRS